MLKRYHYQRSPCVCGFLTSISKKLSGTLYISSICNCNVAVGVYCTGKKDKQVGKGGKEVLTVWPRPIILESSNALLRAKGDTVVIVVDVDVDDCGGERMSVYIQTDLQPKGPNLELKSLFAHELCKCVRLGSSCSYVFASQCIYYWS